jgi:hypothetical protein
MWSVKTVARCATVVLAGIVAGSNTVSAFQGWQQYRLWRERDPSGADASLTFAQLDLAVAGLSLAIAALVWWLLRPKPR